jgi:adenosylmethionine-8-amino-7-oxononanoate aminotransferase
MELVKTKETKESFDSSIKICDRVAEHAQSHGLIIRSVGNHLVLSPPLTLTKENIDEIMTILNASFSATEKDLIDEGIR